MGRRSFLGAAGSLLPMFSGCASWRPEQSLEYFFDSPKYSILTFRRSADGADWAPAFSRAMLAGEPVFFPAGDFNFSGPVELAGSDISISGVGFASRILGDGPVLVRGDKSKPFRSIDISSISVEGRFGGVRRQRRGGQLLHFAYGDRLRIRNVRVANSGFFGIYGAFCDSVEVDACVIENCARDGMNFSGSRNISIRGGRISSCGDDAIAVHHYSSEGLDFRLRECMIQGVQISDCFGVKVLGARGLTISGNSFSRCKGYAVYVGFDPVSGEGFVPQESIVVSGNRLVDWISPSVFGYPNMENQAINISSASPARIAKKHLGAGEDGRVALVDSLASLESKRISVSGNLIFKRPLGSILYSDLGYGTAFVPEGLNPNPRLPVNFGISDGMAMHLGGQWSEIGIQNNYFANVLDSIFMAADSVFSAIQLTGNKFRSVSRAAIFASSPTISGRIFSSGNLFDISTGRKQQEGDDLPVVYRFSANGRLDVFSTGDFFSNSLPSHPSSCVNLRLSAPVVVNSFD